MSSEPYTSTNDLCRDANADRSYDGRFIGMFSYGSNNERQLRARVKSLRLKGCPALLDNYVRIFGFNSPFWGGSVASIAPKEGGQVHGCFYLMTPCEVEILDLYEHVKEGSYLKEAVMVRVCVSGSSPTTAPDETHKAGTAAADADRDNSRGDCFTYALTSAITYIISERLVQTFAYPSVSYLTAVYRTLTSSFPALSDQPIDVCDHTGRKRGEWMYPGSRTLPLEAFLLEVGLREEPPWTFPLVLEPLARRLRAAGIASTEGLCEAAMEGTLLRRLTSANKEDDSAEAGSEVNVSAEDGIGVPGSSSEYGTESAQKLMRGFVSPEFTEHTMAIIIEICSSTTCEDA